MASDVAVAGRPLRAGVLAGAALFSDRDQLNSPCADASVTRLERARESAASFTVDRVIANVFALELCPSNASARVLHRAIEWALPSQERLNGLGRRFGKLSRRPNNSRQILLNCFRGIAGSSSVPKALFAEPLVGLRSASTHFSSLK